MSMDIALITVARRRMNRDIGDHAARDKIIPNGVRNQTGRNPPLATVL